MRLEQAQRNVEAILFASGEAVETEKICAALELDEKTLKGLIDAIRERYLAQSSPYDIVQLGSAYQMCTLPEYAEVIRKALILRKAGALSPAALEVLAVIAYNQPVTRSFIEQVRGVDCSSIVRGLVDKALVEEAGRLPIPGKPIAYQTTPNFLRCFGLASLAQLPDIPTLEAGQEATQEAAPEDEQLEGQIDFFE